MTVLGLFVALSTWTSHNQWEAHAQQDLLARSLEIEGTTDSLTGSLNRRAFLQRPRAATRSTALGEGSGLRLGVCLIDLDGFKQVNDTQGHAVGDSVLLAVAQALRGAVRCASPTPSRASAVTSSSCSPRRRRRPRRSPTGCARRSHRWAARTG